jgi:hypothetical protein
LAGGVLARERPALFRDLLESFKVGLPLPDHSLTRKSFPSSGSATFSHPMGEGHLPSDGRGKTGGAATPPYHKPKMAGLTCRSAPKSGLSRPANRFVHGCELLAV